MDLFVLVNKLSTPTINQHFHILYWTIDFTWFWLFAIFIYADLVVSFIIMHWFIYLFILMMMFVAIELSKGDLQGIQIEYIDISALPFLNTDLEEKGRYPPEVEAFRSKILLADSILFASPEYNYSVTGTLLVLYSFIKGLVVSFLFVWL